MKRLAEVVWVTALGYALMELYLLLRPADLTDQLEEFLATAHGRFEQHYIEHRRHADQRAGGGVPLGE